LTLCVYYYPSYEAHLSGEAKEAYDAMKYADDSLDYYYNQLLFHDDVRALPKMNVCVIWFYCCMIFVEISIKKSCGEAFGARECIDDMINMHGYDFIERVENKNYYGNTKLKEIIKDGLKRNVPFYDAEFEGVVDEGYAILYGRVVDKDGYVNLRASDDLKSNIIGRITSGEDVRFVDMTQDEIEVAKMLKVRTKDGRVGYVHSSRLRLYIMHTDKSRESILEEYRLPYIKKYEW